MNRSAQLIQNINLTEQSAILLSNESNMFYISGYTGEGLLLIANQQCTVITDFRYTEQAENETDNFVIEMTDKDHSPSQVVSFLLAKHKIKNLYFEASSMTVTNYERFQKALPNITFKSIPNVIQEMRSIKDEAEINTIKEACKISGDAFEALLKTIKCGMTEKEVALMLEYDMQKRGATSTAFSTIVAAGKNGSLPHAVPGNYRIKQGDLVTIDFGAKVNHYCADMTRTIAFGQPSAEMKKVYDVVLAAQRMSEAAIMPGKSCREVDAIARDYINSNGYQGRFGHGLGHSLGIEIHEEPRLNPTSKATLQVGQLMTVEPGIYLPGIGGVRIENTVVVTKTGSTPLTLPTLELIIIE